METFSFVIVREDVFRFALEGLLDLDTKSHNFSENAVIITFWVWRCTKQANGEKDMSSFHPIVVDGCQTLAKLLLKQNHT